MKLFIVESPNKCGKIKKHLGSEYSVAASVGHIRAIPKKGINVDVKNGFTPKFEVISGKKKVIDEIRSLAKKADEIILATDPDREGEAISWHIYDMLDKASQAKCTRVSFTEITKTAIQKSLKNPRDINMNLVDAQKARQVLDRLIGYKVSPVLWYTVGSGTSAGRVQSVALKFVCERHNEIEAFKPEDFWYIESLLQNDNGEFWAKVVTKDKENRYFDEKLSKEDFEKLKTAIYTVDKIDRKEKVSKPYHPFDTPTLQTACSSLFGWNGTKTMKIAQSLYEAGKVTYIRSDSFNIAKEALDEVRDLIGKAADDKYLPARPNTFAKKSGAAAQEAHECIRPTHVFDKCEDLVGDEAKMYKLIRDRFIACQMAPMIVDTVTYHIKTDTKHKLIAKGQTIKFDGWFKVYKYSNAKEVILPEVSESEKLNLRDVKHTKHTTKPPARYNDGSLVKKMDSEGVGRPSTLATIVKSLIDKGYIEREKGKKGGFAATPLGLKVTDYLEPRFKDFFMDAKYTSALEDDLNKIADGDKTFLGVVGDVYKVLQDHIKEAKKNAPEKKEAKGTGVKCVKCDDGEIVEKSGRFGNFFSCNKYPECKTVYVQNDDGNFVVKQKTVAKKTGRKCPECEKEGRRGELLERKNKKNGDKFLGCSEYPKCKYSESLGD